MWTPPRCPEPVNQAGQVLLSRSQLAFLHGLYDRPNGRVHSYREWMDAARPYLRVLSLSGNNNPFGTHRGILHMPSQWVARRKRGSRIECTLTPRGRAILEREVPAYIRRHGGYNGLRSLVAR